MTKKYFKIGLLAILLNFTYAKSQTSTLTNNIVDFSTIKESEGNANINIPFHQISIKGYTLPVNLNYNSEGVKVDNESSNLGQNWELSTTGVITRKANGYFDESTQQVFAMGKRKYYPVGLDPYGGSYIECIGIREVPARGYLSNLNLAKHIYNDYKSFVPPIGIQSDYNNLAKIKNYLTTTTTTIGQNVVDVIQDVHPDKFTVVIPNKATFTFLFDQDGNIVNDSNENFKIVYDKKGLDLIQEFVLIDEDGIKYTFSNLETFNSDIYDNNIAVKAFPGQTRGPLTNTDLGYNLDQNSININTPFCVDNGDYPATPDLIAKWRTPQPVSWYLSKIENIYGEKIKFLYEGTRTISIPKESYTYMFKHNNSYPTGGVIQYMSGGTRILLSEVPIIKNITSDKESLVFEYRRFRQDVLSSGNKNRLKELNSIYLYQNFQNSNFSSGPIKKINFNQSYVLSYDFYSSSAYSDKAVYKRLFLDGVDVLGKGNELLSYFKFTYKEPQKLPYKQSFNIDFWGYYKSGDNVAIFPNLYYYQGNLNNFDKNYFSLYPRAIVNDTGIQIFPSSSTSPFTSYFKDATPNLDDASRGILTDIESFGGKTSYTYESNYYDYYGISRPGPGLRIKKILRNDGTNDYTKEFSYGFDNNGKGYISYPTNYGYLKAPASPNMWWPELDHYVTSFREGTEKISYDIIKIEEKNNQNNKGFTVNKYSLFNPFYNPNINIDSFSYVSPTLTSYLIRSQGLSGPYYYDTQNYYALYENKLDNINGYLLNQKVYDSNNKLLKVLTNTYTLKFSEVPDYVAYITGGLYYSNYLLKYLLSKETIEEKFGSKLVTTETSYLRNSENKVNEINIVGPSNNSRTTIKFQYEDNTTIGNALRAQNRLNDASIIKNYNNNELIETTKRVYKTFSIPFGEFGATGTIVNKDVIDFQYEEKSLDGTNFMHNSEVTKYGLYGNVVESKFNGQFISTVLGYNGTLPIATVIGADNSQISTVSQDIINASNNASVNYNESNLQTQLDAFRTNNSLKDFSIETFVHEPLIGKKISTTNNGIKEYTQYDGANRVAKIMNQELNIVKEFNYNYVGTQRFYNTKLEQLFTRNNCHRLENSSSYNYVVPAGAFSSSINQAEAEQKATEEISLMGQYTANIYASCDPKPFDCTITTYIGVNQPGGAVFNHIYQSDETKFQGQIAFNSKTYNWSSLGFEVKVGTITGICQPIIDKIYFYNGTWNLKLLPNGDLYASWKSPFGNVTANSLIIIPFEFNFDNL